MNRWWWFQKMGGNIYVLRFVGLKGGLHALGRRDFRGVSVLPRCLAKLAKMWITTLMVIGYCWEETFISPKQTWNSQIYALRERHFVEIYCIHIYICIMTAGFSRWPPHVFPTWHAKRSTHNWCSARSIGTMTTFVITLWTSLAAGSASHLFLGTLEFLYAKKGRVSVGSVR